MIEKLSEINYCGKYKVYNVVCTGKLYNWLLACGIYNGNVIEVLAYSSEYFIIKIYGMKLTFDKKLANEVYVKRCRRCRKGKIRKILSVFGKRWYNDFGRFEKRRRMQNFEH